MAEGKPPEPWVPFYAILQSPIPQLPSIHNKTFALMDCHKFGHACEMKKTTKQADKVSEPLVSSDSEQLTDEQLELREQALAKAAQKFAKTLARSAVATRKDLVNQVFSQLSDAAIFNWADHAKLCVALCDIRTRDGLLRILHDEVELRPQVCDHLAREMARAGKQWVAPLATVFGGIVWLAGFPDQTRTAINQALEADPSYSLAQLLDIALRHNVPASIWSASLEAVSFQACLKGAA